jgi:hypothetical protein
MLSNLYSVPSNIIPTLREAKIKCTIFIKKLFTEKYW